MHCDDIEDAGNSTHPAYHNNSTLVVFLPLNYASKNEGACNLADDEGNSEYRRDIVMVVELIHYYSND